MKNSKSTIDDLAERHWQLIRDGGDWQAVWCWFLESDRFQEMVWRHARAARRRSGLPEDCVDDLVQDVLIRWAGLLRRSVDLKFDPSAGRYDRWLSILLSGCSGKAVAQFRDRPQQAELLTEDCRCCEDEEKLAESHLDLVLLVNQLPDPIRYVMTASLSGKSTAAIARDLGRSQRSVYRWIEQGRDCLAERFQ